MRPLVYGLPTPELGARAARGEVALGGCIVPEVRADLACTACGMEFVVDLEEGHRRVEALLVADAHRNPWRAPTWHDVHGIQWEGSAPTGDRRARLDQRLQAARRAWQPAKAALRLLGDLRQHGLGQRVLVHFWDIFVATLGDDEGPHGVRGTLAAAEVRTDVFGLEALYLHLRQIRLVKIGLTDPRTGSHPLLAPAPGGGYWLNLADARELRLTVG